MEAVHKTYRRPWVTDLINVKEFRDAAHQSLIEKFDINEEVAYSLNERMMRFHGDGEELEKREKSCSAALLDCEGEEFTELCREFRPPENNDLETLKHQSKEMDKRNDIITYRNMVFQSCRYRHYSSNMAVVPRKWKNLGPSEVEFVPVPHPNVMLTVQIYRPEMQQLPYQRSNAARTPTFNVDQQFYVLGSQCLTEVRDMIICQSDAAVHGEFSESLGTEEQHLLKCQEIYKSGFFYINGTFYNDMREIMNRDYSQPIIEWSKTAKDVGPFTVAKMENTTFEDLEIQLGLPYLYQHQGHCEHMLVFSELRMVTSKDPQNLRDYPLIQILQAKKPVHCMACLIHTAKWFTVEDKRLPELPYFFCDRCFKTFYYDVDGNRIVDFKAYRYFDKTAIF